jgi:ribulose-phosphate 3-epimerase
MEAANLDVKLAGCSRWNIIFFPKNALVEYNYTMEKQPIQVYPSILSGDFGNLAEEAKRLEASGADGIHIDIMDGLFVRNLTLGPKAVSAIRKATDLFLDVHLMIYNPEDYIESFVAAGADRITFHIEATENVQHTIDFIHKCGKKAGLALRPETSFSIIPKYLGQCDLILLMTVNPGFGGQKFMPEMIDKIMLTRENCDRLSLKTKIQVDGGINDQTALECIEAGADVLVSGDYLFSQTNMAKAIASMKALGLK